MKAGILKGLLENIPNHVEVNFWDTHDSVIDEEIILIHDSFDTDEKNCRAVIGCNLDAYKSWFLKMHQKPYEVFTPEEIEQTSLSYIDGRPALENDMVEVPWATPRGIVVNKEGDIYIPAYGITKGRIGSCRLVYRGVAEYSYTVTLDELYKASPEELEKLLSTMNKEWL